MAAFPIGLSDPPPLDTTAPASGLDAWAEIARAGVNFVRNYTVWTAAAADRQMIPVAAQLDRAEQHGLQVWLALAGVDANLERQALLDKIVNAFKQHPGLGAWKGVDEPAHARVPAAGMVDVYEHLKSLDSDHPVAIIEAPRRRGPKPGSPDEPLTVAAVRPYAAACDIHGVDVYPIPRGAHAGGPPVNTDISVVGDMTRIVAKASPGKPIWTTLQIAWSGVLPPHPIVFPTLPQARFMAYDAIVAGARGLFFFGGHLKPVMNERDRALGWNWTYWHNVQRPLLEELTDPDHSRALTAPPAHTAITASAADIGLAARVAPEILYLVAIRKSPRATGRIRFAGIPPTVTETTVLAHPGGNPARHIPVAHGAFTDPSPIAPHNARVYRFRI
jgi:hypothetical protein